MQVTSRNYPSGLPDQDVLAVARAAQQILAFADGNLGELIFHQGAATPVQGDCLSFAA